MEKRKELPPKKERESVKEALRRYHGRLTTPIKLLPRRDEEGAPAEYTRGIQRREELPNPPILSLPPGDHPKEIVLEDCSKGNFIERERCRRRNRARVS